VPGSVKRHPGSSSESGSKGAANRPRDLAAVSSVLRTEAAPNGEPVDVGTPVARREVAVDIHRDARVGVPQDALHSGRIGASHEEQRGRRMAEVVEAERAHLAVGPELHVSDAALRRAPARRGRSLSGGTNEWGTRRGTLRFCTRTTGFSPENLSALIAAPNAELK
jgi:hypothetical protein